MRIGAGSRADGLRERLERAVAGRCMSPGSAAVDGVEQKGGVGDAAGQRPEAGQAVKGLRFRPGRDPAALGLEADESGPGGRDPDRPAPSEPIAPATRPAATAAAAPPLEPPGVWSVLQGLRLAPNAALSVKGHWPTSGAWVLPITTAPASRSRRTTSASRSAGGWRPAAAELRRLAGQVDVVLDRHRDAEQRRAVAAREAAVGLLGLGDRLLGAHRPGTVDPRLGLLGASQREVDQLT